ncbi:hypothetical protein CGRA01v4_06821 [Colletotrichum graminicola]|nr:hypothetical protein CGRA01v4_06821 [Colletotrichum graminicola]
MDETHGYLSPWTLAVSKDGGGCPASIMDGLPWIPSLPPGFCSTQLQLYFKLRTGCLGTGLRTKARHACACWLLFMTWISVCFDSSTSARGTWIFYRTSASKNRMGFLCVCSDGFNIAPTLNLDLTDPKRIFTNQWNHPQLTTSGTDIRPDRPP